MRPGFELGPVVVASILHLALSVAWALPFAALSRALRGWPLVLAGLPFGALVWLVMWKLVLPAFGPQVVQQYGAARSFLEHQLYGLAVSAAAARVAASPRFR